MANAKMKNDCYCIKCSHLDWIDTNVYRDRAWCKIESEEHRFPRSTLDGSFCKDYRKSRKSGGA